MGNTDKVAQIVVYWLALIYLNATQNMSMMSNNSVCPCINRCLCQRPLVHLNLSMCVHHSLVQGY